MSLWLMLLYYITVAAAGIFMLLLLLAGHWLGVFFAVQVACSLALAAVVGIGQALGRPWAHRLARILFMR